MGADICNCKSSGNERCMIECESIMADKGFKYIVKSIGPTTECAVILDDFGRRKNYSSCIVLYPLQVGCHIVSRTKEQ